MFIFSFSYGSRSLPVRRYDYFQCTDNDKKLSQCSYDGPFPNGCSTSSRAAVTCKQTNKCKLYGSIVDIQEWEICYAIKTCFISI